MTRPLISFNHTEIRVAVTDIVVKIVVLLGIDNLLRSLGVLDDIISRVQVVGTAICLFKCGSTTAAVVYVFTLSLL